MNKTILLIEDRPELCENIADILKLKDYLVLTASNGKDGVKLALARNPDLIICDILMPELDGYGVLGILNQHPCTSSTPFIFLTAKSELPDQAKGMELGADEYLIKPFEGNDLLERVNKRLLMNTSLTGSLTNMSDGLDYSSFRRKGSFGFEKIPDKKTNKPGNKGVYSGSSAKVFRATDRME